MCDTACDAAAPFSSGRVAGKVARPGCPSPVTRSLPGLAQRLSLRWCQGKDVLLAEGILWRLPRPWRFATLECCSKAHVSSACFLYLK